MVYRFMNENRGRYTIREIAKVLGDVLAKGNFKPFGI
jgi:hypothetical protein